MTVKVTIEFVNNDPNTIWNKLAAKLGREPTSTEAREEMLRILREVDASSRDGRAG